MFRHNTHTDTNLSHRDVTVRLADAGDLQALRRLASLDSAPEPAGPMVLAEADGRPAAAVPVLGGRAIADPFLHTAALVEMLELRARQLRNGKQAPSHASSLRARLAGTMRDSRPVAHLS